MQFPQPAAKRTHGDDAPGIRARLSHHTMGRPTLRAIRVRHIPVAGERSLHRHILHNVQMSASQERGEFDGGHGVISRCIVRLSIQPSITNKHAGPLNSTRSELPC